MGSASLPSSIVNLVKTVIGAGVLGIPYVFGQTGILLGVVVLLFCAASQAFALHLLSASVLQAHGRGEDVSFHSLAQAAFGGRKIAGTCVSLCVITVAFGSIVGYLIVVGDLLPEVCEYFGLHSAPWTSRVFWMTAIGWGVELPLCFLSNMDSLKVSSMIGSAGIVYIVIALCYFASGSIELPPPELHMSVWPPPHTRYTSTAGMIKSLPIFIFAFSCAMCVPTLILEMGEKSSRRVDIMTTSAIAICAAIYMLVGIAGSAAFGASVEGNALMAFPNDSGTVGGIVSIFARVAIVVNVMGCIPLYMHPFRTIVTTLLFQKQASDLAFPVRASATLTLFFLSWGLALVIPSLDEVMAFVGSTANMLVGFSLPALFYYLGVSSSREDLQLQLTEKAEQGDGATPGFHTGQGRFRRAAQATAAVSLVLIPILLGGEVYKMFNEH